MITDYLAGKVFDTLDEFAEFRRAKGDIKQAAHQKRLQNQEKKRLSQLMKLTTLPLLNLVQPFMGSVYF